jgi:hypothetical protein
MVHRKNTVQVKPRRVWRVTQSAPQGEYVNPSELVPAPKPPTQKAEPDPGWLVSSFELIHGVEVTDETDSLPGELFDELFMKK